MSGNIELADLTTRFQRATAELTIHEGSRESLQQRLSDAAIPLGLSVSTGPIVAVGRATPSDHVVGYWDTAANTIYYSDWPRWAFRLAQAALLAGKEVGVVANGAPVGPNLVTVMINS